MLSARSCGNLVVIVVIFRDLFLPEDGNSIFYRNVVVLVLLYPVLTEDFTNLHCGKKPELYSTNLTLKF
jgi:hypothetical protein